MKKRVLFWSTCFLLITLFSTVHFVSAQSITTNKDKVITIAVQGRIAPAEPARSYVTTWNGKPKLAIGIGGINYNMKVGAKIFGWASTDRVTMGVATVGAGSDYQTTSWLNFTSIGNEVRVLGGEARGGKGVVIGKFGRYVLVHFEDAVLDKLAIDDRLHIKARGVGLEIQGFKDVFTHGITPELLEKLVYKQSDGKLLVPVVMEIPADIVGQGSGSGSTYGNWHVQTCYPPDVKKYGLDKLRFGDLVLLKDIQTDYGKGYYKGGATLGVVCAGPSDLSGLGIGVTPILSTRFGKLKAKIDPRANIGRYLGIFEIPKKPYIKSSASKSPALKTNKNQLLSTAVEAVVQPAGSRGYSVTYDGTPKLGLGTASINYTVSIGDPTYGWASTDHVEPDVTVQGRDKDRASDCAIAMLACIGNEARILSGEAKGGKGFYIGRHAGSDDLCWFPDDIKEKMTLNDRIQVRARGVGLKIQGFEDVRVNKLSPEALENLGIEIKGDQLIVPVAMEVPGYIMGSGLGSLYIMGTF